MTWTAITKVNDAYQLEACLDAQLIEALIVSLDWE